MKTTPNPRMEWVMGGGGMVNGINVKRFIINILNYTAFFVLIHILLSVFIVPTSSNKARTFIQSSNIDADLWK